MKVCLSCKRKSYFFPVCNLVLFKVEFNKYEEINVLSGCYARRLKKKIVFAGYFPSSLMCISELPCTIVNE